MSHARAWAGTTVGEGCASSGRGRAENPGLPLAFPCIPVGGGHLSLYQSAITLIGCVTNSLSLLAFNSKHSFFCSHLCGFAFPPAMHQQFLHVLTNTCYFLVLGVLLYSSYLNECGAVPPIGFDLHFNLLMTLSGLR